MVVSFPRSAESSAHVDEWPRDPETRALTASRLGDKFQRLALERPSAMAILEMMADQFLAEIDLYAKK